MKAQARTGTLLLLCLISTLALAAPAQANRALITEEALSTKPGPPPVPPPEAQIEGACGIAISPEGDLYVSDYYHHAVDVFSSAGVYRDQLAVNPLDGVCQLAFDSSGNLYANEWHESVMRLKPAKLVFDEAESTGVAVDTTGKVYANDRTQVAVYEPSGGLPVQLIGAGGALTDAYGLAVFGGRVYVPDAATKTVEVFEPSVNLLNPTATISPPGGFNSLTDAAVAVDPTNGHVLVLDNLQPGYEHPKAAIDEFSSAGTFLGQLKHTVIDGEPSGIAVDPAGKLYVTSGNDELSNVFAFGAYTESGPEGVEMAPEEPPPSGAGESAAAATASPALAAPTATPTVSDRSTSLALRRRRARKRAGHRRHERHRRFPGRPGQGAAKVRG
jgi:hypothetical protein